MLQQNAPHPIVQLAARSGNTRIYRISLRALPRTIAHTYVVIIGDYSALIDTGSGSPDSNADLAAGMAALSEQYNEPIGWETLNRIIITHGHIDHYGGLSFVQAHSPAPTAVHTLDAPIITDHNGAVEAYQQATLAFLGWAGVDQVTLQEQRERFGVFVPEAAGGRVDTILHDGDVLDDRFRVIHTPGHCAGMVCLRLNDILFCADHLLSHTNPRLTPSHLEPHNGLHFYFASLDRIAQESGIRLGLAGHEQPIDNIYARIEAIREAHLNRLEQIQNACREPRSILELAQQIYPDMQHPMQQLLAIQAIAARVEYLESNNRITAVEGESIITYLSHQ